MAPLKRRLDTKPASRRHDTKAKFFRSLDRLMHETQSGRIATPLVKPHLVARLGNQVDRTKGLETAANSNLEDNSGNNNPAP
jgi:hypothetical protein